MQIKTIIKIELQLNHHHHHSTVTHNAVYKSNTSRSLTHRKAAHSTNTWPYTTVQWQSTNKSTQVTQIQHIKHTKASNILYGSKT